MKLATFAILTTIFATGATAKERKPNAMAPAQSCQKQAEKAAVKKNKAEYGAETNSCGSKLLHRGDLLETYLVCVSDETDPSEWIVTLRSAELAGQVRGGACSVDYIGKAIDTSTPDFQ